MTNDQRRLLWLKTEKFLSETSRDLNLDYTLEIRLNEMSMQAINGKPCSKEDFKTIVGRVHPNGMIMINCNVGEIKDTRSL